MFVIYDTRTGEILDNTGTAEWLNADLDEGTVERIVTANLGDVPRDQVDFVHVTNPDLQQRLLTHAHTVDPASGEVIVGAPHPEPAAEPASDPDADLAAAIESATTLDELKAALLGAAPAATSRVAAQAAERP